MVQNSKAAQNTHLVLTLLQALFEQGVSDFCICPSARNAPFVVSLFENQERFHVFSFYEERSAAFFALGYAKQKGRPIAVVTTSGTAAGELLPAAMEAYYAGVPLVLITTDRPQRYRGSGAPQVAEQVGLFGIYAKHCLDISTETPFRSEELIESLATPGVLHLNVCLEEPLLEVLSPPEQNPYRLHLLPSSSVGAAKGRQHSLRELQDSREFESHWKDFVQHVKHPLILVGKLEPEEEEPVAQFLIRTELPVYLECLSGLRQDPRLEKQRVCFPDRFLKNIAAMDGVIRVGGIPHLRLWRDFEDTWAHFPLFSLSSQPFTGLARPSRLAVGNVTRLLSVIEESLIALIPLHRSSFWEGLEKDRVEQSRLRALLAAEPHSEPGWIAALSAAISQPARVYLGNSLPIREWDFAASLTRRDEAVWASRGLSGIDGQISSFLGYARKGAENWGIFGDLTSLYDLAGPWIIPQLMKGSAQDSVPMNLNLVVVNNGGGKIFSRMFPQYPNFQNSHSIEFKGFADLWKLNYEKWNQVPAQCRSTSGARLIEIVPDPEATDRFWNAWKPSR